MRPGFILLLKCDIVRAEGCKKHVWRSFFTGTLSPFWLLQENNTVICKQQRLNFHSSGGWRSDIRVSACSGEGLLLCHRPLLVSPHGRGGQEALWGLFYKNNLSIRHFTIQRPHLLIPSPLSIRTSTYEFGDGGRGVRSGGCKHSRQSRLWSAVERESKRESKSFPFLPEKHFLLF